jgi:hypothetical protein
MTTTAICPNCNTVITLKSTPVHCARCGNPVEAGEYVTAQGGEYAGRPVCVRCIEEQVGLNLLGEAAKPNGMGTRPLGKLGPSEVK